MKTTLGWLKTHIDLTVTLDDMVSALAMRGLEVDGIEDRAKDLKPFTVARVVAAEKHPNADKLKLCRVDIGGKEVQVVCGAPNAHAQMLGVFAPIGSLIPRTGAVLKASQIRGVESQGMLCSGYELGLSDDHTGIIELPAGLTVGSSFATAMGLDDPVLDIKITPNRADCLGVRGIARDLAAAGLGTLKPQQIAPVPGKFPSPIKIHLEVPDGKACPLFLGRLVRGVRNGPSPQWLRDRLSAIGLRPISALVDITNFLAFDQCRPLHVFDAGKLRGDLRLRGARPGEKLRALDGKEYALEAEMIVIADDSGAVSLGGVIGGESTGCSETTRDVFIEAALFDPVRTAATGRKLGIQSDARYRFERGLDPEFTRPGLELATKLVLELCGGEPSEIVTAGAVPPWRRQIAFRPARTKTLGGLDLDAPVQRRILESLGCTIEDANDALSVQPPSWRSDIVGEADLVEEVLRIHGYDKIPAVPLARDSDLPKPALDAAQRRADKVRRALAERDLIEAISFSFLPPEQAESFGGAPEALRLVNPIAAGLDQMRPSILPNLLLAAQRNADRFEPNAALFEIGPQYRDDTPEGQEEMATGLRTGRSGVKRWDDPGKPVDALMAKADALAALAAAGVAAENVQIGTDPPAWYHPGRAGTLRLGPKKLGQFGEIHPGMLAALKVDGPAVIKPSFVGISSSQVQVQVLNKQFVRETEAHLEMVLPSVFDLVTPLLGQLPDIPIPSFAGFTLSSPSIAKVTTTQDEFIALYANMSPGTMMRLAGAADPFIAEVIEQMDADMPRANTRSTGTARLMHVDTPDPSIVRDELISGNGALPSVTFDVDRYDAQGRELEWSWNLDGGLWRPFSGASPLFITDRAFAWQGTYEIGLRSRMKGDFRTVSETLREKVVIDSVGPQIFDDKGTWDDGSFVVPVWDIVYGKDIEVAWGEVGSDDPRTGWVPVRGASLARATAVLLADGHDGEVLMFARDGSGNQTVAIVAPFHGQAGESGCSCETSGRPGAGGLVLFGLVGASLLRRRRRSVLLAHAKQLAKKLGSSRAARTLATFVGIVVVSSLVPACDCGNNAGQSCETAADCGEDFCVEGEIAFCIDNMCLCSDDIIAGRVGPYSDVATGGGAIWVSAYASSHGDLVVAQAQGGRIPTESWEWVDGVPDGPIIAPDSKIRRGIDENGPDVGMYTSIVVSNDGWPMVSYFDRETASLKFATKAGGEWATHVVQAGTSQIDPGNGGSLVGMYTSMTVRSDTGRPGIAYLAHVADQNGKRAEVRYAEATTATPASSSDWQTFVIDQAPIPENPDEIYPLPGGLGLFIDSARDPRNGAPVVVYYDRANGDLKIARQSPTTGTWGMPLILDGSMTDAGWSPTVSVDSNGVAHVAYVAATGDDLRYTTDAMTPPNETIDDGYRIVGISVDGLPKPEFHFVGDDATIIVPAGGQPMVTYQDATTHELLLSQRGTDGKWTRISVAGNTDPWPGAYGFFVSSALSGTDLVMSTWVINQPESDNWVEVISRPIGIL